MPYSYRIDTDHEAVLFRATGVFTSEELLGCLKEVVTDPRFKRTCNHLVDLRDISEFHANASDMHKKTTMDLMMAPQIGECRIALVSSSDTVYGMTRMYEIMMEDAPFIVHTFRNINAAVEWLGIPEAIAELKIGY